MLVQLNWFISTRQRGFPLDMMNYYALRTPTLKITPIQLCSYLIEKMKFVNNEKCWSANGLIILTNNEIIYFINKKKKNFFMNA
jgi:hypothetical protein